MFSFLQFEDKSNAVFDITEKCGDILDAEMSEDTDHNLIPALESISYEMQNRTGSENSLLDEDDYFLNSGDLAGIPVVGSDNEDDQNFTPKDSLPSTIHTEDNLEDGKRVTEHELDSEKELQIQNAIQKDITSSCDQGPIFKPIRKDFSIARDNGKETFSTKEKSREGPFQEREKRLEKIPKELDSRLKSSFLDKAGNSLTHRNNSSVEN
ncbi:AMP-dependent synthetase [Platysternon megacephalum]|uniref:AMP-dependent synthetase n=1 Tax=Platysternon megacephalum TaxID=55544 RepID=A0A4D9DE01_9SAUR|nr:AMP-dependent synthetase [Platysternon megacephalum]